MYLSRVIIMMLNQFFNHKFVSDIEKVPTLIKKWGYPVDEH